MKANGRATYFMHCDRLFKWYEPLITASDEATFRKMQTIVFLEMWEYMVENGSAELRERIRVLDECGISEANPVREAVLRYKAVLKRERVMNDDWAKYQKACREHKSLKKKLVDSQERETRFLNELNKLKMAKKAKRS